MVKIHHVKYMCSRPFFVNFRKHDCPVCGGELQKIKVSKIVNSESEEAKNYDFSAAGGDGYMFGNVKFIWTEFYCAECGKNYAINDLCKIEKMLKRKGERK